ncbi:MAG: DUF45 domain-containing protein, partial [Bacteroidetes bacterium]|nr:DUF45 domain-containing protein [Bacteroidota bacterium]
MARKAGQFSPIRLTLGGSRVEAAIRPGAPGRVRLRIEGGILQIETPGGTLREAEQLLEQKARWILKHTRQQSAAQNQAQAYREALDKQAAIMGRIRQLVFESAAETHYRLQGDHLVIFAPARLLHRRTELAAFALRKLAENYLTRRTRELAQLTQSQVNAIRVKS